MYVQAKDGLCKRFLDVLVSNFFTFQNGEQKFHFVTFGYMRKMEVLL